MNLPAGPGVTGREVRLVPGHGVADYLLFVGAKAAGVIEVKPEGHTLSGVEIVDEIRSALGQVQDILGDLEQRVRAGGARTPKT